MSTFFGTISGRLLLARVLLELFLRMAGVLDNARRLLICRKRAGSGKLAIKEK
jgi:hypothetical protein